MRGEFEPNVTEANRLLDEQRRVIQEVARRCHLKGKHYYCRDCPAWEDCGAKNLADKEERHAGHRQAGNFG
jgi:hypothetical protein